MVVGPLVICKDGMRAVCCFRDVSTIDIPASVVEIGESCFSGCSSLSRVTFAAGSALRCIGKWAFGGCNALKELDIPASVEIATDIGVETRRLVKEP